jgi:hypothetical protein
MRIQVQSKRSRLRIRFRHVNGTCARTTTHIYDGVRWLLQMTLDCTKERHKQIRVWPKEDRVRRRWERRMDVVEWRCVGIKVGNIWRIEVGYADGRPIMVCVAGHDDRGFVKIVEQVIREKRFECLPKQVSVLTVRSYVKRPTEYKTDSNQRSPAQSWHLGLKYSSFVCGPL